MLVRGFVRGAWPTGAPKGPHSPQGIFLRYFWYIFFDILFTLFQVLWSPRAVLNPGTLLESFKMQFRFIWSEFELHIADGGQFREDLSFWSMFGTLLCRPGPGPKPGLARAHYGIKKIYFLIFIYPTPPGPGPIRELYVYIYIVYIWPYKAYIRLIWSLYVVC